MKFCFSILFLFLYSIATVGQNLIDSGFTNRAEAKIDTDDLNKLEGKWITYLDSNGEFDGGDTAAPFYVLTVFKNGERNGIEREFYKSCRIRSILPYSNGHRNGVEKGYYENGAFWFESNWSNSKRNGIDKEYYENGQLKSESFYVNGKMDGIWKTYFENGKLKSAIPYNNGIEDTLKKIDKNGNEIK
jgi:hypothetical protein